jgi:hypothetical protein
VTATSGVHHIGVGKYAGDLNGHLLNSNGVVTADAYVKIAFFTSSLDRALLTPDLDGRHKVGSLEYEKSYSRESLEYIGDPSRWPEGVRIVARKKLFNEPADAASFLTRKQAEKLQAAKTPRRDFDSNAAVYQLAYLFAQFKAFYPDTLFLFDWADDLPNGYAFKSYTQKMIVLSGGLARIGLLSNAGLAMILAHLVARLGGINCVGIADYEASGLYLSTVYEPLSFPDVYPKALKQVTALFGLIETEADADDDRCKDPSLKCRIASIQAGAAMLPVPSCADPEAEGFQVAGATAVPGGAAVQFNETPDVDSAQNPSNYTLDPTAAITSATVDANLLSVKLEAVLEADTEYVLTVTNVTSTFGDSLAPDKNTASFKTAEA